MNPPALLAIHNYYRCVHGTQPIQWNDTLAQSAEKWAYNRSLSNCSLVHSHFPGVGENIADGTYYGLTALKYYISDIDMTNYWYHETWDFAYGSGSTSTYDHFSQMIWNGTNTLGCAWVWCSDLDWEFWVCQYYPPGNYGPTENPTNVPAPCRPQSDCMYTLKDLNLTYKYGTTTIENSDLQPNTGATAPSSYTYPTGSCWFPESAYGIVFPSSPSGGPNKTGLGVGLFFMFVVIFLAIYLGYVYWKKKKSATSYTAPSQSSATTSVQSPQKTDELPSIASPSGALSPTSVTQSSYTPIASPSGALSPTSVTQSSYTPAPSAPQNNGWTREYDDTQKTYYYYNPQSGTTQWDKPQGWVD